MKLVTSTQMRALEQRADVSGNSYATMMERAGRAVADAIVTRLDARNKRVLVLVGPGNNGGDGLVCARYLHAAGIDVSLYIWKRTDEADENLKLCRERNIPMNQAEEDREWSDLGKRMKECDIIVDALIGTGVTRPIAGTLKDLLEVVRAESGKRANRPRLVSLTRNMSHAHSNVEVVAVDLPSGLNPDTGALDPAALDADLTVTFAFPKIGQFAFPGANAVGDLMVADIGIPDEWASEIEVDLASERDIAARLPVRSRDSHKGTFGKALICAGSLNYTGAAFLAGTAATRAGAGLVTLALPRTIYPIVTSAAHETTFVPLPDSNGALIPSAAKIVHKHLKDYDALLVGPGFGRDPRTVTFVRSLLGLGKEKTLDIPVPLVIDADALFALAQTWKWSAQLTPRTAIVTPHPGEMATLCGLTRDEVQSDRIGVARKHAEDWNQVVVLKGAYTVVAAPEGRVTLIPFATPALATAGTGDVLAGTIVAMLAQGLVPYDAAVVGAYVHGLAGTIAEEEIGRAGVVAGDLLPRLPRAISMTRGS
jgi:ADP-dependent NAD(P)H-hydrate dehydratase / NAD(P)H-hydrate epimerase